MSKTYVRQIYLIFIKHVYVYDQAEVIQFAALRAHGSMYFKIVFVLMPQLSYIPSTLERGSIVR